MTKSQLEPPFRQLDRGIRHEVRVLWRNGIETFESCEGGHGHSFHEPTVRFHGDAFEGFKAIAIAQRSGLRVAELRRFWYLQNGEPHGPHWEIIFYR